jgi:hypothetical protein
MKLLRIALVFAAIPAHAQLLDGVSQSTTAGGAPTPPACSNALDFSVACNSQYIPVVLR